MVEIVRVTPKLRLTALALLFSRHPADEHGLLIEELLESERAGEISLDGFRVALDAGVVVGTVLYVMQPDKTAFIWPPVVASFTPDPQSVEDALLREVTDLISAASAWIGQCIVEPTEIQTRQAFSRNGFQFLTDLEFMNLDVSATAPSPVTKVRTAATFSPESYSRFANVIEASYVDTLDCPLLNNHRTIDEAINSHKMSGKFDATRWKVYEADGEDVGVLLLSEYPEQQAWEIVYLGIVPSARGRGYGREMLTAGINDAREQNATAMFLAVDCRNHVARNVYMNVGFNLVTTRSVHGRFFNKVSEALESGDVQPNQRRGIRP